MIQYALACEAGHEFESWFPSSASYDEQAARGFVTCPVCDSARVAKRVMAPAVARRDRPTARPVEPAAEKTTDKPALPVPAEAPGPAPVALLSEPERALRAMLKAVREHVVKTADHVGERFPEEARRMHYGEIEHRSIYGAASAAEVRDLLDEGIEIHPLPPAPDDRN
jgi:hypothetical protein